MTAIQRDLFLEIAFEYAVEAEPYEGAYSGRGMGAESTLAVVVGKESDAHWIAGAMTERAGDGRKIRFWTDNLGMQWVAY